jgi:hypothetical protein
MAGYRERTRGGDTRRRDDARQEDIASIQHEHGIRRDEEKNMQDIGIGLLLFEHKAAEGMFLRRK